MFGFLKSKQSSILVLGLRFGQQEETACVSPFVPGGSLDYELWISFVQREVMLATHDFAIHNGQYRYLPNCPIAFVDPAFTTQLVVGYELTHPSVTPHIDKQIAVMGWRLKLWKIAQRAQSQVEQLATKQNEMTNHGYSLMSLCESPSPCVDMNLALTLVRETTLNFDTDNPLISRERATFRAVWLTETEKIPSGDPSLDQLQHSHGQALTGGFLPRSLEGSEQLPHRSLWNARA